MERRAASTTAAAGATLLIVVFALAAYVGGYFALVSRVVEVHSTSCPHLRYRLFNPWLARIYRPAGRIEAALTGDIVEIVDTISDTKRAMASFIVLTLTIV